MDNLNHKDRELLRLSSEVFARKRFSAPDVEKEWDGFRDKKVKAGRSRRFIYLWSGVAAVAAIAIVVVLLNIGGFAGSINEEVATGEVLVFKANESFDGVTLTTESGSVVKIGDAASDSLLAVGGVVADEDGIDLRNSVVSEMQTLTIPRCMCYKVVLEDGTEVWLNAESSLSYPSQFTEGERVVYLEGEAYFKVSRDDKRPFVVNTGEVRTQVLGTQFNVKSYSAKSQNITLVEGRVRVDNVNTMRGVDLMPGQDASLNSEGDFVVKVVDTYAITRWKDGYFYFNNVPLSDIVSDIGRWYNVDISFMNSSISDYHLHFVADRNAGLQHVLDNLNMLQKVQASVVDDRIVIK